MFPDERIVSVKASLNICLYFSYYDLEILRIREKAQLPEEAINGAECGGP
jgi:hypothetical protein